MLFETAWKRRTILLASAVALFVLYVFGLTRTGLLGPDEPRYAAIGKAMFESGDYITPRLWGNAWFEKPPLLYWMTAAGFMAGLDQDLAPRLPVALLSVGFLIYFFIVLRQEFGERVAIYASTILATSAGWLAFSHVAVTDLPMSAVFAAAMLIVLGWQAKAPAPHSPVNFFSAGILLGLAVLAKGLVPLVLFLPAIWFLRRRLRGLLVTFGTAAIVAIPWYAAVTWRNGTPFLEEFFWKHHFARFATSALLHERPFWFYLPVLFAGLFPWSPLILLLFSKSLYADRRARFLAAWFAWGLVFFSLSRNKLPGYLLPLLPPAAALLGLAMAKTHARATKMVALIAASAALLWFVPAIQDLLPQALLRGFSRARLQLPLVWILPALVIVFICAFLEWKGQRDSAIGLISVVIVACVAGLVWQTYPQLDQKVSPRGFWTSHTGSITCVAETDRSWRYGLNYYAERDLPDCK